MLRLYYIGYYFKKNYLIIHQQSIPLLNINTKLLNPRIYLGSEDFCVTFLKAETKSKYLTIPYPEYPFLYGGGKTYPPLFLYLNNERFHTYCLFPFFCCLPLLLYGFVSAFLMNFLLPEILSLFSDLYRLQWERNY